MLIKMSFSNKGPTTFKWALVRALTGMNTLVSLEVAALCEPLSAYITDIWTFARMSTHMDFQCAAAHKALTAVVAFERPLASMSAGMISKVTKSCETLSAGFTLVWLLFSMNTHMRFQISFFLKALSTFGKVTLEGFFACVALHM